VFFSAAIFLIDTSDRSFPYRIVDLGMGDTPTCAVSINDSGRILIWETRHVEHVISFGERPSIMKAWVREPDGTLREIPGLGGKWIHPREIDSQGGVIGEAETEDGKPHGFIWDGSGEVRDLGELGFYLPCAEIHCSNDEGMFGGMYFLPPQVGGQSGHKSVPAVWDASGETIAEFKHGEFVSDVNNKGAMLIDHGPTWEGGIVSATGEETSLGSLGHQGNRPLGMNDSGEVVGYSSVTSTLQGTVDGIWGAIKRRKASIRWEDRPNAFLWKDGQMTDLNDLVDPSQDWELLWAFAINNQGAIVGAGQKDGSIRAFLLEPNSGEE
jgi:probable HAF family extracellular repeat protein